MADKGIPGLPDHFLWHFHTILRRDGAQQPHSHLTQYCFLLGKVRTRLSWRPVSHPAEADDCGSPLGLNRLPTATLDRPQHAGLPRLARLLLGLLLHGLPRTTADVAAAASTEKLSCSGYAAMAAAAAGTEAQFGSTQAVQALLESEPAAAPLQVAVIVAYH